MIEDPDIKYISPNLLIRAACHRTKVGKSNGYGVAE
jgi:hypothetical protein